MTSRTSLKILVLVVTGLASGCADALDAVTSHARPVASVAGEDLGVSELASVMAESPLPDSALTPHWAGQIAHLWTDYVSLTRLYQAPDSTAALDYDDLLTNGRYFPALAVARFRDSVVLAGIEPTDAEVRAWFDETEPLTRLDVRRIRIGIPEGSSDAVRDSLLRETRRLRDRVAAGADFIEVARAASDEPPSARGQVLAYQGHADFHPAADSVVFRLRPGEISPVVLTDVDAVFYRVERRRTPEFAQVEDMVRRELEIQRRESRLASASDSLLANARRVVADDAERVARAVATGDGRGPAGSLRLVRWEGGEFTVAELRDLFSARADLRRRFAAAEDEEIGLFLYQLAGDEILIDAARRSGVDTPESARTALREGIGGQLAAIARRMDISHVLVTNPLFDIGVESRRYIRFVLERSTPVPVATEFRPVLDRRFPSRVDERSAATAARQARQLRGLDAELATSDPEDAAGTEHAPADGAAAHDDEEGAHDTE